MESTEIRQTVTGEHNIFTASGDIRINYQLPPAEAEDRRNLLLLADNVKRFWIEGVLERSLHEVAMLELRKEPLSDAVQHPWERVLELPGQPSQSLAGEKKIGEIFFETGRCLLILGEPGAGKTVTLLELARELIGRFETDPTQSAPVVLNLSTWQDKRRSLANWIEVELKSKYFVPPRRCRGWLASSRLLLLLDGLDEVPAGSRTSCVYAINEFIQNTGAPGIAVCSRRTEYTTLPEKLSFTGAVCLQPLTIDQINGYLEWGGSRLAALRHVIREEPPLQELAQSPLMLNVISLAYQDLPAEMIADQSSKGLESRRKHLFECYVKRMFQRIGKAPDIYPQERAKRWLSWLARRMRQHSVTVFLIEHLQPSWLPSVRQRWVYAFSSRISIGLSVMIFWWTLMLAFQPFQPVFRQAMLPAGMAITVFSCAVAGIIAGATAGCRLRSAHRRRGRGAERFSVLAEIFIHPLVMGTIFAFLTGPFFEPVEQFSLGPTALHGWPLGILTGVKFGLVWGLFFGFRTAWRTAGDDIQLSGTLRFSFEATRKAVKRGGISGAIFGVILVVVFVMIKFQYLRSDPLELGVAAGVAGLFFGLIFGLIFACITTLFSMFSPSDLPEHITPGHGLILSVQNALLASVAVTVLYTPVAAFCLAFSHFSHYTDYLQSMAGAAIPMGFAAAIWYGGLDVIQHFTLRFLLRRHGYIPKNYVKFLDYATRLIFLQKVGSGYIFVHRQLLDYFFELPLPETEPGREFLEASISESHREEEKRGVARQPLLEIECAPSRAETERTAEAEQRAKEQRKDASKLRHRVVLAVGAVVVAWMGVALILLVFWEKGVGIGYAPAMNNLGVLYQNGWGVAKDYVKAREWYQKAADAGSNLAMNNLGWLSQNGWGSAQDYVKAREWYQKAADAGNNVAMNNLGWLSQNGWGVAKDYVKAREWYQKAADAGSNLAMNNLGWLSQNGWGVPQDYIKAREWYQKAADAGSNLAMNNLGWLSQNGWGVPQDYIKAREWYQKAADAGNNAAMNNLGWLFQNGLGGAQDYIKAREWYQKAADAGSNLAMNNLGWLSQNGLGGAQDYVKARQWYQKAADAGNTDAMNNLGLMYETGWNVAQDYVKARQWYQQAANAGYAPAMNTLGSLYETGRGVAQDYVKARQWYQKAAAAGNASAMNKLGWLYQNGWGLAQDYAEARRWYQKAADAGDSFAMNNLASLYETGRGVAQDYAEARRWYQKTADARNAFAMNNVDLCMVGWRYETGRGVAQDYVKAREWYQKAADAGNTDAKQALLRLNSD